MTATEYLGDPGERLAASALCQAMQAEVQPGTSNDDDDKVDLRLVYTCPFTNQRRELRCQVKAGDSFGKWTKTKNRYTINLKEKFRKRLNTNDAPTLLIWIAQSEGRIYYCFIPPSRSYRRPIYISASAVVSPAMLLDVARNHLICHGKKPRQISFSLSSTFRESLNNLKSVKQHRSQIETPAILRNLSLPLSTIRHVTRTSRPSSRRRLSCDAAPYLPAALRHPPRRIQCFSRTTRHGKTRSQVHSLLLLEYPSLFRSDTGRIYSLDVRVTETVSFPRNWEKQLLCLMGPHRGTVDTRSSVQSWYLKPKKNN